MYKTLEELKSAVKDNKLTINCDFEGEFLIDSEFEEIEKFVVNEYFSNFADEIENGNLSIEVGDIKFISVDYRAQTLYTEVLLYVDIY